MVEVRSPLPAVSVLPMGATTPVVGAPVVMTEHVQHAPVIDYVAPVPAVADATLALVAEDIAPPRAVTDAAEQAPLVDDVAPAPAVSFAALTPVIEHIAPVVEHIALVVEHIAPAPSVHAEQSHVDVCIAPAPAMAYTAQAPVDECIAQEPAVSYAAPARVIESAAPISADDCHASMLHIIETFHQSVRQIPDDPALASTSSACAAPAPVDCLQLDREA